MSLDRPCDTEVDDLRQGSTLMLHHQDVRGLQVSVDDTLLVCVVHSLADFAKQVETRREVELILGAVASNRDPVDELHDEEWSLSIRQTRIVNLCDRRVIHPRHRLAFRFESGENICTEHSYKFTVAGFGSLAAEAGWAIEESWTDRDNLFAILLLRTR